MLNKYINLTKQAHKFKNELGRIEILKGTGISILSLQSLENIRREMYFTPDEISYSKNRIASLAGRYTAKIAVRQALKKEIPWKDIRILPSQSSQPILYSSDTKLKNINLSLSITHEDDFVAGIAVYAGKNNPVAVGIDATRTKRLVQIAQNQPRVLANILTPYELKSLNNPEDAAVYWAGKEAVSKALGIGVWHGGSLREIEFSEIIKNPRVKLTGSLLKKSIDLDLNNWKINFINNEIYTVALVLAVS